MSSPAASTTAAHGKLDLSGLKNAPAIAIVGGLVLGLCGLFAFGPRQFAFSYLTAYMFCLSLCLGGLFLTLIHHIFDAGWSVPVRRMNEHLACLLPWMTLLFVPIALRAGTLYDWMDNDPHADHALLVKQPLFTKTGFYLVSAICFGVWSWLALNLRRLSLEQDRTGSAECTVKMRFHAAYGIFLFAFTLTLAAIMWMKALQHQFFSTMYGVYYFAGSVWTTLATLYIVTRIAERTGHLRGAVHKRQYHDMGVLFFAFTVFYAYIHFSQYFLIWNAAIPEETFWYVLREQGTWWDIGLLIVFGHFLVPFLTLLRSDAKVNLMVMAPVALWALLMHFLDVSFNIGPVIHPDGFPLKTLWIDLGCVAFIGGVLAMVWVKNFNAHPAFPQKDPRWDESQGHGAVSSADAELAHFEEEEQ